MTGNELFVKALQKEGIDYLFAYPGGYAIDIFDELYKQDSIYAVKLFIFHPLTEFHLCVML